LSRAGISWPIPGRSQRPDDQAPRARIRDPACLRDQFQVQRGRVLTTRLAHSIDQAPVLIPLRRIDAAGSQVRACRAANCPGSIRLSLLCGGISRISVKFESELWRYGIMDRATFQPSRAGFVQRRSPGLNRGPTEERTRPIRAHDGIDFPRRVAGSSAVTSRPRRSPPGPPGQGIHAPGTAVDNPRSAPSSHRRLP
jgi:hypothetical protein